MDFERKTVVRAICLNRNPQFRTSKHCPLACVFGISVGAVQNPKLWILEIGSEFRNLDFARTLCPKSKTLDFGNWIGISEFGFCAYVIPLSISRNFWDLGWREYTRSEVLNCGFRFRQMARTTVLRSKSIPVTLPRYE